MDIALQRSAAAKILVAVFFSAFIFAAASTAQSQPHARDTLPMWCGMP